MTIARTVIVATLVASGALTGCGSGPDRSAAATVAQLRGDMRSVAAAATAHNYPAVASALRVLDADAAAARANGTLSADRLAAIRAALVTVRADLPATPTLPATVTVAPSTNAPPAKGDHKGGHGHEGGGGGDGGD